MSGIDRGAKLAGRANGIAAFFRAYPEAEAAAGIRDHIAAFWTPAMREALGARIASGVFPDVDPLVSRALAEPPAAAAPGRPETAGPREAGAIGASDGG